MRAQKITEAQENANSAITDNSIAEIQSDFERLEFEYSRVQERLLSLDLMLDNHGWNELLGGSVAEEGPDLDQIKEAAGQIRELTAVNAHMKQGNLLRGNYVWDGGIHYENVGGAKGAGNRSIQRYIDDPQNQRNFFGPAARKARAKARYTDGHNIYIGEDSTKLLKPIYIERVTAILVDPEDPSEIWALRINRQIDQNDAQSNVEPTWIFLDEFIDKRKARFIPYKNNNEPIDYAHRIFLKRANRTVGWTWGTPDALAAMQWVRMYREFMISGKKMSDAMAMIWAQAKGDTKQGAQNAAVQFGNKQGSGGIAVGGPELAALATAGKGYDFSSGQAILAAAAAALEVSVIALSANPGAAGSSYGSAQTLDLPGRIAIAAIRAEEAEFDEQILRWMGARNAKAWFDTLLDAEGIYRAVQAEMLYWATGLRAPEEQKREMDKIKGKPTSDTIPDGIMTPNNTNFPGTLSNDTQPIQQASPDQGKSNGSGGAGNLGNQRRDTIGGSTGA